MKNRGFSMLELVISQATLMVVILAFAGLWAVSQQGIASARLNTDLALKVQEVRDALKRETACSANFNNIDLSLTNTTGAPVPRVAFVTPAGALEKDIVSTGQVVDGHRVTDMRLRPIAQVDGAQISAVIEMTFQRSGMLGPATVIRSVGVLAQVRQGKVQKCRLLQDGALSAGKRLCVALTDGALNDYDPVRDECTLMNGKWIMGNTIYQAYCPAGFDLPKTASAGYNCSVREPAGFVDPSPTLPVSVGGGKQAYVGAPPPYRAQLKNGSCECSYDIDIPTNVREQFQCQILCLEL